MAAEESGPTINGRDLNELMKMPSALVLDARTDELKRQRADAFDRLAVAQGVIAEQAAYIAAQQKTIEDLSKQLADMKDAQGAAKKA